MVTLSVVLPAMSLPWELVGGMVGLSREVRC